jgi:hypothetical protein
LTALARISCIRVARRIPPLRSMPLAIPGSVTRRPLYSTAYRAIRAIVRSVAPALVAGRRARLAADAERLRHEVGDAVRATFGALAVADGPFAGMRYTAEAAGSSLPPKLVGSYEAELVPFLELAVERGWGTVINVGCAEGYYAVGLARRMPAATVLAFDADPQARALCTQLAELNAVSERVIVGGAVDAETLARHVEAAGPRTGVICDCEGAELWLLREEDAPRFAQADLIIELHDFAVPGCGDEIVRRLSRTHYVSRIAARHRRGDETTYLRRLPDRLRTFAADENRPPGMEWAVCVPRAERVGI